MKKLAVLTAMVAGVAFTQWGIDADANVRMALSLLWVIALLWLTETLHITITALLVPVIAVATGLLSFPDAVKPFSHPIIFLFFGGFALAIALHVQQVDKWLADAILARTGGRLDKAVFMLAAITALMSMWMSNTAVTAVMLPLILGLLSEKENLPSRTQAYCLLVIAYSANIGGMGTMIGTAPNALVAAELGLSFTEWLAFGVPIVLVLWPLMMVVLWRWVRPDFGDNYVNVSYKTFEWTTERRWLMAIFTLTVACWLLSKPLSALLGISKNVDSWVALSAVVLLGVCKVFTWQQFERSTEWGVLLLFGGGLTLSEVLKVSGASTFLGVELAGLLQGWSLVLVIAVLVTFVVFLTEVASNTATTALLVPVFVALPMGLIEPSLAALAIGLSSSCAFMLPVATPPNALVHGTGKIKQQFMMNSGIVINIAAIVALTIIFTVFKIP